MGIDRRLFLQGLGGAAAAAALQDSIARAVAIGPAGQTGTIADVEHVVILMQENRSFDHYFGSLCGVRGFGDPRAVHLPSGNQVWYQPNGQGGFVLPFHPSASQLGLQFLEDLSHDWTTTHAAWNGGHYDNWVPSKSPVCMAHLTRADIPFHYALADAFTVCDAYHCSVMGPTFPNRHHMWTGCTGNDGKGGGPALQNGLGYNWSTFPEQLEKGGVSWKIYQDQGKGLDAAHDWGGGQDPYTSNYGCNTLLGFEHYQNALPGSALFEKARKGTNVAAGGTLFDTLRQDCMANCLPQVSWIVAPEAFTEHPNWPANYGAWYVAQVLDALTSNPEVWSSTAFLLTYDENDGFFDHVVPPTPPPDSGRGLTTLDCSQELFAGSAAFPAGPFGLGMRVPMIVISPWSTGGWVNSQVFDHTSMIRFILKRFPQLSESNITKWRSAVCGDLTSAFRFSRRRSTVSALPEVSGYAPPDALRHADYSPAPPQEQAMPVQEPGTRPACGLPYSLNGVGYVEFTPASFNIRLTNTGSQTAVFQVRSGIAGIGPRSYTVQPLVDVLDTWMITEEGSLPYDFQVYGPNGFFRAYKGGLADTTNVLSVVAYDLNEYGITLQAQNLSPQPCRFEVVNLYDQAMVTRVVATGHVFSEFFPLKMNFGWYDVVLTVEGDAGFRQQFAGHLENGLPSRTDPRSGA